MKIHSGAFLFGFRAGKPALASGGRLCRYTQCVEPRYLDIRESDAAPPSPERRPFLQVIFLCGPTYVRVYRNRAGDAYEARCPKCGKPVRFRVGEGGTDSRAFEVDCRR
ncbi:MAG: hypothetical protein JSS51_12225 [Planctomycetes bacterium]|nr:hypothetical protein [Planctomycetota bacterium]